MASYKYYLSNPFIPDSKEKVKIARENGRSINRYFKKSTVAIRLFITFSKDKRIYIRTGQNILPKHWDFEKGKVIFQVNGATEINRYLENFELDIKTFVNQKLEDQNDYTASDLKQLINNHIQNKTNPKDESQLTCPMDVFDAYIEERKDDLKYRTIQKFKTTRNVLKKFAERKPEYSPLKFWQMDAEFMTAFKTYLLHEAYNSRTKKHGYFNETAAKHMETLYQFLKWSKKRGFYNQNGLEIKKTRRQSRLEIVTLSLDEVKFLKDLDLSTQKRLERVRDVFLFMIFTGQRWSDVERFDKTQIIEEFSSELDKNILKWKFKAYKTEKLNVIPFVGFIANAIDILEKYNYILPVNISNQKFNDALKDLGTHAGLDRKIQLSRYRGQDEITINASVAEKMSTHMGRRTCASILLNDYHVSIDKVQQITKHEKIETLMKYIIESDEALASELSFKEKIKKENDEKDAEIKRLKNELEAIKKQKTMHITKRTIKYKTK